MVPSRTTLIHRISTLLLFLLAVVLGFKKLLEPDIWWYLRTGEWIQENGSAPTVDTFSFTFQGTEWINVKWLYEWILYGFSQLGGAEFVGVFQALVAVSIVAVWGLIYREVSTNKNSSIWLIGAALALLVCSYRMTARPETISHLFTLLMLALYLRFRRSKSWVLLLWAPVMALWVNLHEAYGTGLVIVGILTAGELFARKRAGKNLFQLKLWVPVFASVVAIMINPRGWYMLIHPLEIFSQLGANQFTTELHSVGTATWWVYWQSYVFLAWIGLVVLFLLYRWRTQGLDKGVLHYSPGYIVLLAGLAYLGFTSQRNIPFFIFTSTPILFAAIGELEFWRKVKIDRILGLATPVLLIGMYVLVVTDTFYRLTDSRDRFGLEVYKEYAPVGMSEVLQKMDYKQAHFSDYLTSSYPLFALSPDYQSFIDLRDLDVFPQQFFIDVIIANQNPRFFDEFDERYQFQYAYLKRTDFINLIGYLNQAENWKMVYADPVSVLFVKAPDVAHEDLFVPAKAYPQGSLSYALTKIFNPLYAPREEIESMDLMAGYFYRDVGDPLLSLARTDQAIQKQEETYLAHCLKGEVLDMLALQATDPQQGDSLYQLCWHHLKKAQKIDKNRSEAFKLMALSNYQRGQAAQAAGYFKRALKNDPNDHSLYSLMADCQNMMIQSNPNGAATYQKKWFEYMEQALERAPDNPIYLYRLGVSYCERGECDRARPMLQKIGPMAELSKADNDALIRCKKQCDAE